MSNKIGQQFGLTPAAKARVSMPEKKKDDNPLKSLMNKIGG